MTVSTAVPSPALTDTGFVAPAESAILAGLLADFQVAFGGNLNPALETPQGQLISSLTAVLGHYQDAMLYLFNQFDPAYASGRMQDAIARIYYLTRIPSAATYVECLLSGATGTIIPVGALAIATDGTLYENLSRVTIDASGTVSARFSALTKGPIPCPAGSLVTIYRTVPGWDSITNPHDGVTGRADETRQAFEARRSQSVAVNALGILPAMRGAVLAVPDVLDAYVTENPSDAAQTIGGVQLAAHSLYVAVVGGTDPAVARAILSKKNPGCGYTGSTTVSVTDDNAGYSTPPSYAVTFTRPSSLDVTFAVSLRSGNDVPADAQQQISTALSTRFQALARIGTRIYASAFYGAVGALGDWVRIEQITVNGGNDVDVHIDQFPDLAGVTVTLV
jgi:hypothetical protein